MDCQPPFPELKEQTFLVLKDEVTTLHPKGQATCWTEMLSWWLNWQRRIDKFCHTGQKRSTYSTPVKPC